jgi:hypothetical protein
MSINHLSQIKENIDEKYHLLYGNQQSLNTLSADERPRVELKIMRLRREIQQCEVDLLSWLKKESTDAVFLEEDAQIIIDELIKESTLVDESSHSSTDLIKQSKMIREGVDSLRESASVKIKPVINLLPPSFGFVIEGELDAKSFIVKNIDAFKQLFKNSKK